MQLSKRISVYFIGLVFLLTAYTSQAKDYIVAFKSARDFKVVMDNF